MRRGKGFGCLVSKGRGKPYLARWVYQGKVYTKSTGESDRRKAERELERLTRPFREERELDVLRAIEARIKAAEEAAARPVVALNDLYGKFEALPQSKDITESTRSRYGAFTDLMTEFMKGRGRTDIGSVTEADAEAYLAVLAERCGPVAYNVRLVFFKRLWREFGGGYNPFEKFPKRKVSKASPRRSLTEEEVERVLVEATKDPDDELLFSLGVYTGLRVSDCALMKAESVDLETGVLRVVPIKTKRHMSAALEIPMHPALRKVIEKALAKKPSGYLSERNAYMYTHGTLTDRTSAVLERVGIETSYLDADGHRKLVCGFHSLRHTFVSMSIDAGMNPLLVQRIVGHTSVNMTSAYFHANKKAIEEGINKLPDFAA